MKDTQWLGIILLIIIFAFVAIAFRRSMGTKPGAGGRAQGWMDAQSWWGRDRGP